MGVSMKSTIMGVLHWKPPNVHFLFLSLSSCRPTRWSRCHGLCRAHQGQGLAALVPSHHLRGDRGARRQQISHWIRWMRIKHGNGKSPSFCLMILPISIAICGWFPRPRLTPEGSWKMFVSCQEGRESRIRIPPRPGATYIEMVIATYFLSKGHFSPPARWGLLDLEWLWMIGMSDGMNWMPWGSLKKQSNLCCLVVWLPSILCSHQYWVANHPNWRTHIFQRGGPTTNQFMLHSLLLLES